MENKSSMTVDGLYDYITKHMTPEQALKRLLATTVAETIRLNDEAKPNEFEEGGSPLMVIIACAKLMGWNLGLEKDSDDGMVRGLVIGSAEYLDKIYYTN